MKRVVMILMLVAVSELAFGQAHTAGTKNLNVGVGLGNVIATGDGLVPPIGASFEVGIKDNISVGGYFGYTASEQQIGVGSWKYTYMIVGARGAYHRDFLDNDKLDTYGGLLLGYNIASVKWEDNGNLATPSAGGFTYSFFIGGRYAFTDSLGAFAELGYGISWLQLGVNLKL